MMLSQLGLLAKFCQVSLVLQELLRSCEIWEYLQRWYNHT
eukprot:UN17082